MATHTTVKESVDVVSPEVSGPPSILVVDLGKKQSRKSIRKLRRGEGPLMEKLQGAVEEIKENGAIKGDSTIVVVVREKARRSSPFLF